MYERMKKNARNDETSESKRASKGKKSGEEELKRREPNGKIMKSQ